MPRRIRAERLRSYGPLAWCYDELAAAYSLGRIRAAKHAHLADLQPGERVLYPGVGRGEEALVAARLGAEVTALDCAPQMLDRLRAGRDRDGLELEVVLGDLFSRKGPSDGYDCIAAHFVLDVFEADAVADALAIWIVQLRPGGRLEIADFAPPRGVLNGLLVGAYYGALDLAGWALGLAALHRIYDYESMLAPQGWQLLRRVSFGPYESLTFVESSGTRPGSGSGAG